LEGGANKMRAVSDQLISSARQFLRELSNQFIAGVSQTMGPLQRSSECSDHAIALAAEAAWHQMRQHPALLWVPPVWRTQRCSDEAQAVMLQRAVSALDRNLVVELGHDESGVPWVRIATGRLQDRPTNDGVDPLNAAGSVDPKLDVTAPSFPEAVLQLRDRLVENYGEGVKGVSDGTFISLTS
jgi:hypothetical protein